MSDTSRHSGSRERRRFQRFPLQLGVDCAFYKRRVPVATRCKGQVQNLSADGCYLALHEPAGIEVGMIAQLWIDWPVASSGAVPIQLHVRGRVLRVEVDRIAVTWKQRAAVIEKAWAIRPTRLLSGSPPRDQIAKPRADAD